MTAAVFIVSLLAAMAEVLASWFGAIVEGARRSGRGAPRRSEAVAQAKGGAIELSAIGASDA